MAPIASANRRTNRVFPVPEVPARMTKGFDLRETAHQSSGLEVLLETYPDFASEFLRGGLQKGVGKLLPGAFSGSSCNQMQQLPSYRYPNVSNCRQDFL